MRIYLLPGIACDHRLFDRVNLRGLDVVKLDWPHFRERCGLVDIAKDLSLSVDATEAHVLVGVSMGGMVALELALITKPERVVLISTWTGPGEWPWFVRWSARVQAEVLINSLTMRLAFPARRLLGARDETTDRFLMAMALKAGPTQIRRATHAILRWKGSRWTGSMVRIHGDKDALMPLALVHADHVVPDGTHAMIYCQPEAVSAALRTALTT
ncbi:MAG: alpha/beta hydrolase [Flavobacteriales bacterium]